jgi:hypothetical protein
METKHLYLSIADNATCKEQYGVQAVVAQTAFNAVWHDLLNLGGKMVSPKTNPTVH